MYGDGKIIVRMKNVNVVTKDLKNENIVWQKFFFFFFSVFKSALTAIFVFILFCSHQVIPVVFIYLRLFYSFTFIHYPLYLEKNIPISLLIYSADLLNN